MVHITAEGQQNGAHELPPTRTPAPAANALSCQPAGLLVVSAYSLACRVSCMQSQSLHMLLRSYAGSKQPRTCVDEPVLYTPLLYCAWADTASASSTRSAFGWSAIAAGLSALASFLTLLAPRQLL